ncbi:MAG: V-type ATPase 116kDa subunit family protein, partial [Candidatus Bathyarchaeia archaeon]
MVRARAYFHEQYADQVLIRIAEEGILHQTEVVKSLEAHEPHIRPVEPSERLFKTAALISRVDAMLTALNIELYTGTAKAGVTSEGEIEDIDRELSALEQRYSALTSRLESPDAMGATSNQSIDNPATNQRSAELSNEYRARLLLWRQRLENTRTIEEAKSRCARTKKTLVIEGWIPRGRVNDFERAVNTGAEGYCATSYTRPYKEKGSHSHETESIPPTKIKNPRIAYVYEKLVTGFGLPNYFEVDPTVFMIVSFPVIFGLMFGDIGHGLILLGLSLLLVAVNRSGFRAPELFEYLIRGSPLLV